MCASGRSPGSYLLECPSYGSSLLTSTQHVLHSKDHMWPKVSEHGAKKDRCTRVEEMQTGFLEKVCLEVDLQGGGSGKADESREDPGIDGISRRV